MNLLKIARNIQYQAAKIEVIELLFRRENADDYSLTTKINYNLVSTLRQHLFDASEACFEATPENLSSCIATLQDTLSSATEFLAKINTDSISLQIQFPILEDLIADILTKLNQLNAALNQFETQPKPPVLIQNSDNSISVDDVQTDLTNLEQNVKSKPEDNCLDALINLCDGDDDKAQSWIQFEQTRNPELSRKEAIESAITIKTNLDDKSNLFIIIQKVVSEYFEIDINRVTWDGGIAENVSVSSLDVMGFGFELEEEFSIDIPDEISERFIIGVDSSRLPPWGYDISDGTERYYHLCSASSVVNMLYKLLNYDNKI